MWVKFLDLTKERSRGSDADMSMFETSGIASGSPSSSSGSAGRSGKGLGGSSDNDSGSGSGSGGDGRKEAYANSVREKKSGLNFINFTTAMPLKADKEGKSCAEPPLY